MLAWQPSDFKFHFYKISLPMGCKLAGFILKYYINNNIIMALPVCTMERTVSTISKFKIFFWSWGEENLKYVFEIIIFDLK